MMTRLDRYIARQVGGAVFIVALVIIGLDLMFALVDQLPDLSRHYDLTQAMWYVALTSPRRLYEYLPLSCLIGALVGLGTLASSSELTVMRAAGISTQRIIVAVCKPVLLIITASLLLGEYVVPQTEQTAQTHRVRMMAQDGRRSQLNEGAWHREGQSFIHIDAVATDGRLFGVTRYQFDENRQLQQASFAREGEYVEGGWKLKFLRDTRFYPDRTEVVKRKEELWQSGLTPSLLNVVVMEPANLSISGLNYYSDYLRGQGLQAAEYHVAFWTKVLQPVAILGLVLVAVSFIFGPLRSVTLGQRLIAGVIVGLVFKLIQDVLGPASAVFAFPPLLAVLVPIIACYLVGILLLRRAG
ncbi:LPS export ABC transporter permease LptG [Marinobacterium jannaschii]|uniref:LPS export ABC transporter permease LptG n=1 Tax=Marinobacterium jannaschii TaxID=64970 RepID=UPI000AAF68A8|nr:LPS export ABC transporter permease LptG [Marinobacterium jannaschii]